MAKKVTATLTLVVPAGKANPAPPIGPALGSRGVNIMEFCKSFNARTSSMEVGCPLPVYLTVYSDKSFTFELGTPLASWMIKKAAKLEKGSQTPGKAIVGKLTVADLRKIVSAKMPSLTAGSEAAAIRTLAGTARSMGVNIEGLEDVK